MGFALPLAGLDVCLHHLAGDDKSQIQFPGLDTGDVLPLVIQLGDQTRRP